LVGLDCHDRGVPQVTVTKPVADNNWSSLGLINPAGPMSSDAATGELGAGKPASLIGREVNPDSRVEFRSPYNTSSIE
jgi:hypothetical protein